MRSASLILLALTAAVCSGEDCAKCHAKEASAQPKTMMGRALLLPGGNRTLEDHPALEVQLGRFRYSIVTRAGKSTYSVSDGTQTLSVPIQWTFGAQSQTYLLTRDGTFYESLVSYYPAIGGLDVTMGDGGLKPQRLEEALGRPVENSEAMACFACHSTNPESGNDQSGKKWNPAVLKPGLTCEHCHAGAAAHAQTIGRGGTAAKAALPEKLGKRSAESVSNFCGQCHRSWETVVRNNWRGELNVRFQPYRLETSKCFDGTDARISCVACHNPHEDVVRGAAAYDRKCIACHSGGQTVCRIAKSECTTCHMPKVALPGGHQIFTDHRIRIARAGEAYPN